MRRKAIGKEVKVGHHILPPPPLPVHTRSKYYLHYLAASCYARMSGWMGENQIQIPPNRGWSILGRLVGEWAYWPFHTLLCHVLVFGKVSP